MRDILIATAIMTPFVLCGIWLALRSFGRTEEATARALAARLGCPRCHERSLEWRGVVWGEDVSCDDRDESLHGYVFSCARCDREFRFLADGELRDS